MDWSYIIDHLVRKKRNSFWRADAVLRIIFAHEYPHVLDDLNKKVCPGCGRKFEKYLDMRKHLGFRCVPANMILKDVLRTFYDFHGRLYYMTKKKKKKLCLRGYGCVLVNERKDYEKIIEELYRIYKRKN